MDPDIFEGSGELCDEQRIHNQIFSSSSGTCQGDPLSAYLFILVMEILFIQIRNKKNIRGLRIFGYEVKLTSFADDVSCFLDVDSIKELLQLLKSSYFFNSLKINYEKSEVCGIGSKKGAVRAFSNLSSVDLTTESIKILGCHHSYNKQLAENRNFLGVISDIQNILSPWSMRGLSLLGKIQIFNTLGTSKILYVSSMTRVPKNLVNELKKIQIDFLWNSKTPKIKHSTLIADYSEGDLKSVDIESKINAMKLTRVKRLSDNYNHPWKIIPSNCFILPNGESIFHRNFRSNVSFNLEVSKLPPFYKEIVELWSEFCFQKIDTNSTSYSESLWYNSHIRINNETLFIRKFHLAGINKVGDLYESDGKLKSFDQLSQNNLPKEMYFKWMQLTDAIPSCWKRFLMLQDQLTENSIIAPESKFLIPVYNNLKVSCSKLTCKVIYSVLLKNNQIKPTSVSYWQQKLNKRLDNKCWEQIFLMPWKATIESYTRCFQFKIINNALFLNSQLHKFGLVDSPKCSFCDMFDETSILFFSECNITLNLWQKIKNWLKPSLALPKLNLKNALLVYIPESSENTHITLLINHILLIFKQSLFEMKSRNKPPSEFYIINRIKKTMQIEYQIAKSSNKISSHFKKWDRIINLLA